MQTVNSVVVNISTNIKTQVRMQMLLGLLMILLDQWSKERIDPWIEVNPNQPLLILSGDSGIGHDFLLYPSTSPQLSWWIPFQFW